MNRPSEPPDTSSEARLTFLKEALCGVGPGAEVLRLLRTMRPAVADAWLRCGERIVSGTPSPAAHLQFLQEIGLSDEDARSELAQLVRTAT